MDTNEIRASLQARIEARLAERKVAHKRLSHLPTEELEAELRQAVRVVSVPRSRGQIILAILDAKYTTEYLERQLKRLS